MTYVSDLDYNATTGLPMVEWDTDYGRYWQSYESEAARQAAIEQNERWNQEELEMERREAEREKPENYRPAEGHPVMAQLLVGLQG